MNLSPLNRRRFELFKANKRGWWSLWLFLLLFGLSLGAELIANDKPLVVHYDNGWYFPALKRYPETTFGGEFPLEANYKSPYIRELLKEKDAWVLWAPIPYSYQSINYDLKVPAPAPPSTDNLLGTDDQGRDVLARVIYGFRISVLFALTLTILSSIIGVIAGALVRAAGAVPADHSCQFRAAEFLVAAGDHAAVLVDEPGGRGPRRIPARA
jgi:microcin C transport system permease protein